MTTFQLCEAGLKNVLAWLPVHERKADHSFKKMTKAEGLWYVLWYETYYYHTNMASRMRHNLDRHYQGSDCIEEC